MYIRQQLYETGDCIRRIKIDRQQSYETRDNIRHNYYNRSINASNHTKLVDILKIDV